MKWVSEVRQKRFFKFAETWLSGSWREINLRNFRVSLKQLPYGCLRGRPISSFFLDFLEFLEILAFTEILRGATCPRGATRPAALARGEEVAKRLPSPRHPVLRNILRYILRYIMRNILFSDFLGVFLKIKFRWKNVSYFGKSEKNFFLLEKNQTSSSKSGVFLEKKIAPNWMKIYL